MIPPILSDPGTGDEGIVEPVPCDLHRLLRRAVLDHSRSEPRRVHPPLVHVGVPGAGERALAVGPGAGRLDHALRTDAVAAMRAAAARGGTQVEPMLWLTRTGPLELQDVDAEWLAAARAAYAEAAAPLVLVVVTRRGWWDPRSGTTRTWQRLRER